MAPIKHTQILNNLKDKIVISQSKNVEKSCQVFSEPPNPPKWKINANKLINETVVILIAKWLLLLLAEGEQLSARFL